VGKRRKNVTDRSEEFRKIKPCCTGYHVDERVAYDRAQADAEAACAANPELEARQMNVHAAMGYDGRRSVA
jgi:hypothetical protein